MTEREKLKEQFGIIEGVWLDDAGKATDFTIDKCFNYFESRTCENCKYWDTDRQCEVLSCMEFTGYADGFYPNKNFGCNQWESK